MLTQSIQVFYQINETQRAKGLQCNTINQVLVNAGDLSSLITLIFGAFSRSTAAAAEKNTQMHGLGFLFKKCIACGFQKLTFQQAKKD